MKIFFVHKEDTEKINIDNLMKKDEIFSVLKSHVEYFINLNDSGRIHIGLINFDSLFNSKNVKKNPVVFTRIINRKMYFFTKVPSILIDTLRENKIEKSEYMFDIYPLIMSVTADIPKDIDGFALVTFDSVMTEGDNENVKTEIIDIKSSKDIEFVQNI